MDGDGKEEPGWEKVAPSGKRNKTDLGTGHAQGCHGSHARATLAFLCPTLIPPTDTKKEILRWRTAKGGSQRLINLAGGMVGETRKSEFFLSLFYLCGSGKSRVLRVEKSRGELRELKARSRERKRQKKRK